MSQEPKNVPTMYNKITETKIILLICAGIYRGHHTSKTHNTDILGVDNNSDCDNIMTLVSFLIYK